uniref:hypothetical protein n=1 Tax=Malassezia brasiliensis TaxID=1821822 RepID=UPI003002839A|nr:hypothetical protein [Malassezia brasiliensis]WBU10727.1 hypothetical protein [Malassezia brasiliensis]
MLSIDLHWWMFYVLCFTLMNVYHWWMLCFTLISIDEWNRNDERRTYLYFLYFKDIFKSIFKPIFSFNLSFHWWMKEEWWKRKDERMMKEEWRVYEWKYPIYILGLHWLY